MSKKLKSKRKMPCAQNKRMRKTKRTYKDSLFTSLFHEKQYGFQLYKVLHPEDNTSTEDDLQYVTIENVVWNGLINDLGMLVGDRLLILIEAQSTWNPNMTMRSLLYMAKTYEKYIQTHKLNLYAARTVRVPVPELYVVYTGHRHNLPEKLELADLFAPEDRNKASIQLEVKMLYNSDGSNILNQYIYFCHLVEDLRQKYNGDLDRAIEEAISICKENEILATYLEDHEMAVKDTMGILYDDDFINACIEKDLLDEGRAQGLKQGLVEGFAQAKAEAQVIIDAKDAEIANQAEEIARLKELLAARY